MSGFEVAGVVLGAFPIAIVALEQYREVAKRLGFWMEMRVEYQKCKDELKFHQLVFTRNLRQLILPLIADDDKVRLLLSDPGGAHWQEDKLGALLEKRLGDSYDLYFTCVKDIEKTLEALRTALVLDSQSEIEAQINAPKAHWSMKKLKSTLPQHSRDYYLYKLRFINSESTRDRYFDQLKSHNDKLEKLLDTSDKDAQALQQRVSATASVSSDLAICSFWRHANKFFAALKSAWNCCCSEQCRVQLLLQDRTTKKSEFHIALVRPSESTPLIYETKIISEGDLVLDQDVTMRGGSVIVKRPISQHQTQKGRSALKGVSYASSTGLTRRGVSFTMAASPFNTPQKGDPRAISNLCNSLHQGTGDYCGYLLPEEDCKYLVYHASKRVTSIITLDEILRGHTQPRPSRRQRYALASILASSFLQFIETPLLSATFEKADIVFLQDMYNTNIYALDRPQLQQNLIPASKTGQDAPGLTGASTYSSSLDMLGIILLELCFGALLEDQPCRKLWPAGSDDKEKRAFELMSARDWQRDVSGEAGPDYAESIAWCLGGNRSTLPDQWRELMLRNVVQPLRRCHMYLVGSEASAGSHNA